MVEHGTADDLAIAWVLSTSALSPIGGLSISNGLRPGLAMLIKQLADEHGPNGTRVNGLLPGRISTERVQYLDSLADDPDAARRNSAAGIPLLLQLLDLAANLSLGLRPAVTAVRGAITLDPHGDPAVPPSVIPQVDGRFHVGLAGAHVFLPCERRADCPARLGGAELFSWPVRRGSPRRSPGRPAGCGGNGRA